MILFSSVLVGTAVRLLLLLVTALTVTFHMAPCSKPPVVDVTVVPLSDE